MTPHFSNAGRQCSRSNGTLHKPPQPMLPLDNQLKTDLHPAIILYTPGPKFGMAYDIGGISSVRPTDRVVYHSS